MHEVMQERKNQTKQASDERLYLWTGRAMETLMVRS